MKHFSLVIITLDELIPTLAAFIPTVSRFIMTLAVAILTFLILWKLIVSGVVSIKLVDFRNGVNNVTSRRYGNRKEWKRILKRNYQEVYISDSDFKGYITSIKMLEVKEPLDVEYPHRTVRIVDQGYSWLQHFPSNKRHSVTTMFNENNEVVQTYIDICVQNGVDENGPWWEDLYLDLILLPTGELILQDEDELEEALREGWISQQDYELAWREVYSIKNSLSNGSFTILDFPEQYRSLLAP